MSKTEQQELINTLKLRLQSCEETIKEISDSMYDEYVKGARAMLNHLQRNVTKCGGIDKCSICQSGNKLIKKLEKK